MLLTIVLESAKWTLNESGCKLSRKNAIDTYYSPVTYSILSDYVGTIHLFAYCLSFNR